MPFEIVRNDITKMKTDAIVNAANPSLLGGGGVDGAIHRAAGPGLRKECAALGGCRTGEAKITGGYALPAKYVIHTVGPIWQGGGKGEKALLAACYQNSLSLALSHGCASVAFPLISAGAYGYPKDKALETAVETIRAFLMEHDLQVYLVLFGESEFVTGEALYGAVREYVDRRYVDAHTVRPLENVRKLLWQKDIQAAQELDLEISRQIGEGQPSAPMEAPKAVMGPFPEDEQDPRWDELLRETDEGFSGALLRLIDEKGLTDTECYRRANVDRKLFSKIRSNPAYRPSKPTVFAFAVALEMDLEGTKALLEKAGFALSHSSRFDLVLEYFIVHRRWDVDEINKVLYRFDLPLLGSGMN